MERMWILVGMMGSGKSTIGRGIATRSERVFRDTDVLIQNRFGRSVSEVFRIYGEAAFRDHETSILKGLEPEACVLATGGGIVIRDENWVEMRRLGTTIFLDVAAEVLKARLERSKKRRPLLETDNWQDRFDLLMDQRREIYERADLTVRLGEDDSDAVIERVLQGLGVQP